MQLQEHLLLQIQLQLDLFYIKNIKNSLDLWVRVTTKKN